MWLRQLPLLIVLAMVGCGGEEVDFSKSTRDLAKVPTQPPKDEKADAAKPGSGSPAATPPAATPQPATPPTQAAASPAAAPAPGKAGSPAPAETAKATPVAGTAKKKGTKIRQSGNASERRSFDDEEDDPYFEWRTRTFTMPEREQRWLKARKKAGFSENGRMLAAADENGDVVLFRTKFGQVHALFTDFPGVASVAVSDLGNMLLADCGTDGVRVVEVQDLSRLDLFARQEYFARQASRPPIAFSDTPITLMAFAKLGKYVVIGNESGQVQIREVKSWTTDSTEWPPITTIDAHETPITSFCFSRKGDQIATCGLDGSVRVWDAKTGDAVVEMEAAKVPALSICGISKGYAVGRANGVIEIWTDIEEDEPAIEEILDKSPAPVLGLMVEPKRKYLVRALATGSLAMRDLRRGEELSIARPHQRTVACIAPTIEKDRILSVGTDGMYHSWPPIDLRERRRSNQDRDEARTDVITNPIKSFRAAKISRLDDLRDATYSDQQEAMFDAFRREPEYDEEPTEEQLAAANTLRKTVESERAPLREKLPKQETVAATEKMPERVQSIQADFPAVTVENVRLAVSNSGDSVALAVSPPRGEAEGFVNVWDIPSATQIRSWTTSLAFDRIQFVGGGRWLLPFPKQRRAKRTDYSAGFFDIRQGVILAADGEPKCVAEQGDVVAIGYVGRYGEVTTAIKLLNGKTLEPISELTGYELLVPAIGFTSDGQIMASVRDRKYSRLTLMDQDDLTTDEPLIEILMRDPWVRKDGDYVDAPGTSDMAISPNGSTVALHGRYLNSDFRFTIWPKEGKEFKQDKAKTAKESRSFLVDHGILGPRMIFTGDDSLAALTNTGLAIIDTSSGRAGNITPMTTNMSVFSPNGRWLATHDGTGGVELRDLKNSDRKMRRFRAHDAPLMALTFSADGKFLATAGEESRINVWRLDQWTPSSSKKVDTKAKGSKPKKK